jgi:uncharacterized protein
VSAWAGAVEDSRRRLTAVLATMDSAVLAYSGGVDSTLVMRAAADTPGLRFVAVTTRSATNTDDEVEEASRLARLVGADHLVVDVDELETPGYAANPAHRCYLCKQTLYPVCEDVARQRGFSFVADGVNTDDLGDYRPGLRAAEERGVRHPLVEARLAKDDVRALSRLYGLPTADRPASPCLSSRFPYGTPITREGLRRVAAAEAAVKALGFVELRVRSLGDTAKVEVSAPEFGRLADHATRNAVLEAARSAGFVDAVVSDVPLRSGSLNDALPPELRPAPQPSRRIP